MPKFFNKVIFISQKKTSMRLTDIEWEAFETICKRENIKRNDLIEKIHDSKNNQLGLTCSVRLFTIIYFHHLLLDKQKKHATASKQFCTPIYAAIDGIL